MIRRKYQGQIIYATPGSGKTTLADNFNGIIDADEVILETIAELSPNFEFVSNCHPSINILRYFKYAPYLANTCLYDEVENKFNNLCENDYTVLTGTLRLMYMADFVFIQKNPIIAANRNFDQEREMEKVKEQIAEGNFDWSSVKYMNNYLDEYIIEH
eukprot:gene8673-11718_t